MRLSISICNTRRHWRNCRFAARVQAAVCIALLLLVPKTAFGIACVYPVVESSRLVRSFPEDAQRPNFVVTERGVLTFEPGTRLAPKSGATLGAIFVAVPFGNGALVGTETGIYKLDQNGTPSLVMSSKSSQTIVERNGVVWFLADGVPYQMKPEDKPMKLPFPTGTRFHNIQPTPFGFLLSEGIMGRNQFWASDDGSIVKLPEQVGDFYSQSSTRGGLPAQIDISGSYLILPNGIRIARNSQSTGFINDGGADEFGVLIAAAKGLFSVTARGLIKVGGMEIGAFDSFIKTPDHLIIRGKDGLARRLNATQLGPLSGPAARNIIDVKRTNRGTFVLAENGLFTITAKGALEKVPGADVGPSPQMYAEGKTVWIGSTKGVFQLGPSGVLVPVLGITGYPPKKIGERQGMALLRMQEGAYVLPLGKGAIRIPENVTGSVDDAYPLGTVFLLESKEGLFLLDENGNARALAGIRPKEITVATRLGNDILLGTRNEGIYRRSRNGALTSVPGSKIEKINRIVELSGGESQALVLAENGVFVYMQKALSGNEVEFTRIVDRVHQRGSDLQISWRTLPKENSCLAVEGAVVQTARLLRDGSEVSVASIVRPVEAKAGESTAMIGGSSLKDTGTYTVDLRLQDAAEPLDARNYRTPAFVLESTLEDSLTSWWKTALSSTLALGVLGSAALLFGSRRYRWCFDFLTADRWEALKIWYRPVILYSRPLRLWLLGAYFDRRSRELMAHGGSHYVPVRLREGGIPTVESDKILTEMVAGKPVWIQGESGTGKSELVLSLERNFYAASSWRQAIKTHGFLPIVVPVRDYPDTPDTPEAPWVAEIARHQFSSVGLSIEDAKFFYRLLRCGDIGLILDGLNEVDHDGAVQRYCNVAGASTRFLFTSQSPPRAWDVRTLNLPTADAEFVKALLNSALGNQRGGEVFAQLSSQLVASIRSGYDVELITQCVNQSIALPMTRLQLYDAAYVQALATHQEPDTLDAAISETAWGMFLVGSRRFAASSALTTDMLSPFIASHIVVPRPAAYEFRHDLVRAYVTARRVVKVAGTIRDTVEILETVQLWSGTGVRPGDRRELMAFVCAMINTEEDLAKLIEVAKKDVEARASLFAACIKEAKDRSWPW